MTQSLNLKTFVFLFSAIVIACQSVNPAFAKSRELQRRDYLAAKKALTKGQMKKFSQLANNLKDYPLYPYLRHDYLRSRLWKVKEIDMVRFFKRYSDLPVADSLRTTWLKHLLRKGRWQTFLDNYTPQKETALQCYQLQARIKTGNASYLLEDTRTLWLVGKSQPPQCDPVFERLYKSDLMTNELVWERVRLAMQNNKPELANYLSRRLDPEYRKWAKQWIAMHNNPSKGTKKPGLEDTPISREILIHGIKRLAKQNISRAVSRWEKLQQNYTFIPSERAGLDRLIAFRAAKRKHTMAVDLLDRIDDKRVDDEIFHWRLQTALNPPNWHLLKRWTAGEPTEKDIALRWKYWHARALEETGDFEKAKEIYALLATERDYYGFIAADRIGAQYHMNHFPLPSNQAELEQITNLPAMQRAYEFYQLDMTYPARREWHHALNKLTSYQMQIAAILATQWGWYDRAIITMAKAHAYDDLVIRFPVLFEDLLNKYAKKRDIDPSWMFGLVRAESAFIEDVRSPAGALGLMQIMPKTGKITARRIGLKKFTTKKLLQAETNIPIGSAYMKLMLDKFSGNMVLATTAYNAGPQRVKSWLPGKKECEEPDVWIEKIPFNETRKYVRRVLYFANIYDWRMRDNITPISHRMAAISGDKQALVTGLNCNTQPISYRYAN